MIRPTTQRREGWPHGECVRAAYSALLDVPIDEVPPLDPGTSAQLGLDQDQLERSWLASIGYDLVEISVDPNESLAPEILDCCPDVPHFMSGISPRGYGHRVVGVGGRVAWDPHPSRAGLVSVYSIGFLVPMVPFL